MKYLFQLILFFFFFTNVAFACSCENVPSFCQSTVYTSDQETGLVFLGELLESEPWENWGIAKKFKIVEILSGEIVLPESPLANDIEFENTADEVWVLSGDGGTCLYGMEDDGLALFSVTYGDWFGYVPSICSNNYLSVDVKHECFRLNIRSFRMGNHCL